MSIDRSGTHVVSVYATGLNNRYNGVREAFNMLRPRQDDHNLHIISKYFFQTTKQITAICS